MHTIRICDLTDQRILAFDLTEVLAALGPLGLSSSWKVGGVSSEPLFATGQGASALEQLAASGERFSGDVLFDIARRVRQVIWGEFKAYKNEQAETPWVVAVANDSSYWEVSSPSHTVIDQVASAFKCVERL